MKRQKYLTGANAAFSDSVPWTFLSECVSYYSDGQECPSYNDQTLG